MARKSLAGTPARHSVSALLLVLGCAVLTPAEGQSAASSGDLPAWPGQTARVSVASDGTQGNGATDEFDGPVISEDGRYVASTSRSSNLVPGDTNGKADVFVHDRQTGQTTRVSVASDGTQGNGDSSGHALSPDGRYVAFDSFASNLVPGDTNASSDVFVHDRQTGQTQRVSVASDGTQLSVFSYDPSLSADGRYVAYYLFSGIGYIWVYDRQTGQRTLASAASDGTPGNNTSFFSTLSADGRYIAFSSSATNLVAGDTNGRDDVFVHDRQTGQTVRVSVASDGTQANDAGPSNGGSGGAAISADGRYVTFSSWASNLIAVDTNASPDVFVHDRQTGQTARVSEANDGAQANSYSGSPSISADGRYIAFVSWATNLVGGDTNGTWDVFVHDRQTGQTTRVSVANDGAQSDNETLAPAISGDARFVAFHSLATNLVGDDTNGVRDIFVVGGVSVTPATIDVGPAGGSFPVGVTFDYPGTPWTASSADSWMAIANPAGGSGNGSITLSVAPNSGPARTGTLVAALHTITVTQQADGVSTGRPEPPQNFRATAAADNTVFMQWSAPASGPAATGYLLEVGSTPSTFTLATFPFGNVTSFSTGAPAGTYYVRLRATNASGQSEPTSALRLDVGCTAPPGSPSGIQAAIAGNNVHVQWVPAPGNVARYLLEVGSTSGARNLVTVPIPAPTTSFDAAAPPGLYFLRVRAANACGASAPSAEIALVVGAAETLPGAPGRPTALVTGATVSLSWSPPSTGGPASGYVLEAGSAPGLANLVRTILPGSTPSFVANGVPRGTYHVRVRAWNAAGIGPASDDVAVVVGGSGPSPANRITCQPAPGSTDPGDIRGGCVLFGTWDIVYDGGDDDDFWHLLGGPAVPAETIEGQDLADHPRRVNDPGRIGWTYQIVRDGGGPLPYARLSFDVAANVYRVLAADAPAGANDLHLRLIPVP